MAYWAVQEAVRQADAKLGTLRRALREWEQERQSKLNQPANDNGLSKKPAT